MSRYDRCINTSFTNNIHMYLPARLSAVHMLHSLPPTHPPPHPPKPCWVFVRGSSRCRQRPARSVPQCAYPAGALPHTQPGTSTGGPAARQLKLRSPGERQRVMDDMPPAAAVPAASTETPAQRQRPLPLCSPTPHPLVSNPGLLLISIPAFPINNAPCSSSFLERVCHHTSTQALRVECSCNAKSIPGSCISGCPGPWG